MVAAGLHIGIIPDGNRRWCRIHEVPMDVMVVARLQHITNNMLLEGGDLEGAVREVSVYLLSKDNIMNRHDDTLEMVRRVLVFMHTHPLIMRIQFVGELHLLPTDMQSFCSEIEARTVDNPSLVTFAIAYDPVEDCRRLLDTSRPPRPQTPIDVVLRSGGHQRSSGFFPLHTTYSEWVYTPVLFPDIERVDLIDAIRQFKERTRNFGA